MDKRNNNLIAVFSDIISKTAIPYHRAEIRGLEQIPDKPVLYVSNHNGSLTNIDMFIFLASLYNKFGLDRLPFGLTHELTLKVPVVKDLLEILGSAPAKHDTSLKLFNEGKSLIVYPGGDIESTRPFKEKDQIKFGGRKGYIRLALRANVPLIPVVTAGAHEVYYIVDDLQWLGKLLPKSMRINTMPLTFSFPLGLTLGHVFFIPFPSKIITEVLPPVIFENYGEEAARDEKYVSECALIVEDLMQKTLTKLSKERNFFSGKNIK